MHEIELLLDIRALGKLDTSEILRVMHHALDVLFEFVDSSGLAQRLGSH